MHELVRDYLEKAAAEKTAKKNELLISLGLAEKAYANEQSSEYPEIEYDEQTGVYRYFKYIPVEVSDEEYAEILKCQSASAPDQNSVSKIFKGMAWAIFGLGFIAGIVLGQNFGYDFNFPIALTAWISTFVSGMTCYGIGEIIQLLDDIKKK